MASDDNDLSGLDDGNFKRGRVSPGAVIFGLVVLVGGGAAAFFGIKGESERVEPKQIVAAKHDLAQLTQAEQMPKWREWAKRDDVPKMQEEAFAQLAWAKDPEGIDLIIRGLSHVDHRVRGTAAQAITEYGAQSEKGRAALKQALAESDVGDRTQITWALVVLKDAPSFDAAMKEYREGHFAKLERLDKSAAFDPEALATMVPLDKLVSLASDPSESVRQLVATALSASADAKYTKDLITLVSDKNIDVAREAAVGLGRIANEEAMAPLLDALGRADKDSRQRFLEALRDGVGAQGLVLALRAVKKNDWEIDKFQTRQIFEMLRELADPRGGDPLVAYLQQNPHPHWRHETGLRLAEIGDLRAVHTLAWRMRQETKKLYTQAEFPEIVRDDKGRIYAARMLADLAALYPQKRDELLAQAEDAVLFWATDDPLPHANAMRFLAAVRSPKAIPHLRKWAVPTIAFPLEGQAKPPEPQWFVAQSALRYLGQSQAPSAFGVLESQLNRKPAKLDASFAAMQQGGIGAAGITYRNLAFGAADGLAELGDPKAYGSLVKFIEDKTSHEEARMEACFALAWVATDANVSEIVGKIKNATAGDPHSAFLRRCYLETLIRRPSPAAVPSIVELFKSDVDMNVRHQAARVIGMAGVSTDIAAKLFEKLQDPGVRSDAAMALILGGDADIARRAIASYDGKDSAAMEELKLMFVDTISYFSARDYTSGVLARWTENTEACSRVKVNDTLQDWLKQTLARELIVNSDTDKGPHSLTRVQLRVKLLADARGGDEKKSTQAIAMLKFLREKGPLMALRSEPGLHAVLAKRAFFEVMNPKIVTDALPDSKKP